MSDKKNKKVVVCEMWDDEDQEGCRLHPDDPNMCCGHCPEGCP